MKILVFSYFSPPEFSAAAARVFDNARVWARAGHDVTIVTSIPNYPKGKMFPGYRFRLVQKEFREGVRIVRVASWIAPNRTTLGRLKGYLSLTISQMILHRAGGAADVLIGSSPPLFTALGAFVASWLRRIPFVFEVADLWPANLIAVGANVDGRAVRLLASTERLLISRAAKIVTVTEGFREFYLARGVAPDRVSVVTNGVDLVRFKPQPTPSALAESLGVAGKFVAAYIGTVGLNHGLLTVLAAAERLRDRPEIVFLIVGDGAERASLGEDARRRGLTNVRFLGERPTGEMPQYHALADVLLVLLRDSDYFHRVIPSKIFVAMAMAKPVVLGVRGEAARIVEAAGCGLCVPPEDPDALAEAVSRAAGLRDSGALAEMGRLGREHVERNYDRNAKALAYLSLLTEVVATHRKQ